MQPRSDTDKADAEVAALTKSAGYSLARPKHMHKQAMPDGLLAGHSAGQQANNISDTEDMPMKSGTTIISYRAESIRLPTGSIMDECRWVNHENSNRAKHFCWMNF
jgi:hypothetical protein